MTAHNHTEHVAGCFRCDLSREEAIRDSEVGRVRFDRWHAAELAKAKAEAWDEALQSFAGQIDEVQSMWIEGVTNPYRDRIEEDQ